MTDFFDEQLPADLHQVARRLRAAKPLASDGSINQTKLRLRKDQGAPVGTRKVTAALIAGAMLLVTAGAGAVTGGDLFVFGPTNNGANQGINNAQSAGLILGGSGGVLIVNRSSFVPSVNQGVRNINAIFSSASATASGDSFFLGSNNTSFNQAINNSQSANLTFGGGSGTTIISNSTFAPSINQGACNVNFIGSAPAGSGAPGTVYGAPVFCP